MFSARDGSSSYALTGMPGRGRWRIYANVLRAARCLSAMPLACRRRGGYGCCRAGKCSCSLPEVEDIISLNARHREEAVEKRRLSRRLVISAADVMVADGRKHGDEASVGSDHILFPGDQPFEPAVELLSEPLVEDGVEPVGQEADDFVGGIGDVAADECEVRRCQGCLFVGAMQDLKGVVVHVAAGNESDGRCEVSGHCLEFIDFSITAGAEEVFCRGLEVCQFGDVDKERGIFRHGCMGAVS